MVLGKLGTQIWYVGLSKAKNWTPPLPNQTGHLTLCLKERGTKIFIEVTKYFWIQIFSGKRGLPKHPRLLLMRLTYSLLCDSMQEVGSTSNVSCIGSYQHPHYYYYILRRFTATVKELLLQATKYKYSKLFGIPFKEKYWSIQNYRQ